MPRYAKARDDRWVHPTYKKAYCYRYRNGLVYTSVNSVRKATGLVWTPRNKKLAMEILEQRIREEVIKIKSPSNKYLSDLIKQFHKDKVMHLSRASILRYKRIYKYFLYEDLPLDDVQLIRMNILKAIETTHLSPNTLRKMLFDLKGIFKYAIELEWMDKNPVVSSMLPVVMKKEIKVVTDEHIDAYKKYFEEQGLKFVGLIIEFDFLTALRIQELIDLKWEDVTPRYFIVKGKGSRDRIFPLTTFPRVAEILNELKEMGFYKPVPYKFQETLAKKLRRANKVLKELYPELKFDGVTFHVIRKGAINNWRRMGIDTEIRNILAGHTSTIERQHYLSVPDIELLESRLKNRQKSSE